MPEVSIKYQQRRRYCSEREARATLAPSQLYTPASAAVHIVQIPKNTRATKGAHTTDEIGVPCSDGDGKLDVLAPTKLKKKHLQHSIFTERTQGESRRPLVDASGGVSRGQVRSQAGADGGHGRFIH